MNIKGFLSKLTSGRAFFAVTAVSFCFIIIVTVAVYRSSVSRLRDILYPEADTPTEQVRHNEQTATDPRYTFPDITQEAVSDEEHETSLSYRPEEETDPSVTEEQTEPVISNDSYILPVVGELQREFSPDVPVYDETMGDWRIHRGIDFSCEDKSPVRSVGNGRVIRVVADNSFGYTVEIDHGDFTARYCGLEQGTTLKLGDTVGKGDTVGVTADVPCEKMQGSHLHFEAVKKEKHIDPMSFLGYPEDDIL